MRHLHADGRGHSLPFGDKPIEKSNFTRRKIWLSEKPKKNLLPGLYYLALFLTFILYPRPPPIQSNRRNQYLRRNPATPIHRRPGVALSAAEGSDRLHRIITTPKAFNCHSGVGAGASQTVCHVSWPASASSSSCFVPLVLAPSQIRVIHLSFLRRGAGLPLPPLASQIGYRFTRPLPS